MASIEVQWDRERIPLAVPPPNTVTLGRLKEHLSNVTGVDPNHMKLFLHGTPMTQDSQHLSAYGIIDPPTSSREDIHGGGAGRRGFWSGIWGQAAQTPKVFKIRMIGSKDTRAVVSDRPDLQRPTMAASAGAAADVGTAGAAVGEERGMVAKIKEVTEEAVSTMGSKVSELEGIASDGSATLSLLASLAAQQPPPSSGSSAPMHVWLPEMLLRSLIKLDSFEIPREWTDARTARKEGVRTVQGLLDRVDRAKLELQKQANL